MANEIRVEKCFYDLNEYMDYSGFLTQAEVPYLVFGVEEELAALNAVREASPEKLKNLMFSAVDAEQLEILSQALVMSFRNRKNMRITAD